MTDRPILFSGPMVRAILAGQKTVTRRALKPQPVRSLPHTEAVEQDGGHGTLDIHHPLGWRWKNSFATDEVGGVSQLANQYTCPYGMTGDRLWVRETWLPDPPIDDTWASTEWNGCGRRIADVVSHYRKPEWCLYAASWERVNDLAWKPSIHMPRWASRITLEVTGVTVERLQDITEEQAKAEGVTPFGSSLGADQRIAGEDRGRTHGTHPYTLAYAVLWDELNADRGFGWATNPWVWAVSFGVADRDIKPELLTDRSLREKLGEKRAAGKLGRK
jgi:hypothetical protein